MLSFNWTSNVCAHTSEWEMYSIEVPQKVNVKPRGQEFRFRHGKGKGHVRVMFRVRVRLVMVMDKMMWKWMWN